MINNSMVSGVKWPKLVLVGLAMVLIAAVVIVSIIRDRIVNQQQWQVSVIGQGKVSYQPDIANVTLGVQIDKVAQAPDALNQLNDRMTKIVESIKAVGITPEDIQTQNYSLYPQYDYIDNASKLSGYNANQQLVIKVRGIAENNALVSKVISEATKAGANQVLGVSFDVANIEELKQDARLQAVADAKMKAGKVAMAAGVRLDKVVGWWENVIQAPGLSGSSFDGKGGMGSGNVQASASPVIPAGSQEVIIEMNLNYRIK
jgi:uncharacterized protein YggE